jgi:hypothetical protein
MICARPRHLAAFAALASFALAGCGHTESHIAMLRTPQPRTGQPVELYVADHPPARPFYDIAIVQAIGFGSEANAEDITRTLTDRASLLGCDAVVRVFVDLGYSRAHASGVCVKFLAPGPAGPTSLPAAPVDANPKPPVLRPGPIPRVEPLPSSPNQGR